MIKTTLITWIIAVFGAITFLPLIFAQLIMLLKPNDQKTKDLLIGKGEDYAIKYISIGWCFNILYIFLGIFSLLGNWS